MTASEPGDHQPGRPAHLPGREIVAEFRSPAAVLLAGGPVDLEVLLRLSGGVPATVTTSVARATGRSRDYRFEAHAPDGTLLTDPYAAAVEIGGVQASSVLSAGEPLCDRVLLNQFLTLERIRPMLEEGESFELRVSGARQLHLAGGVDGEAGAEVIVELLRDDAALHAELNRIAESIRDTSDYTIERARQLLALVSIRDPIGSDALTIVIGHHDAAVAAMARQALTALG